MNRMQNSTSLASLAALAGCGAAFASITITEIRTGPNNAQYVEFRGMPGESLAGLTFLIIGDGTIGGSNPTRSGVVEWLWTFGANAAIGPNGQLLLRNPGQNPANAADTSGPFPFTPAPGCTDLAWPYPASGLAADSQFERADNQTYLLVSGYSGTDTFVTRAPGGTGGQDLDTNDDGILDFAPWEAIVDQVSVRESGGSAPAAGQDWWYSAVAAGPAVTRTIVYPTTEVTIAGWDFQTTGNSNGGTAAEKTPNTPKVFSSNAGVGTMYLNGTNGAGDWDQLTELDALTGSGLNATGADGNGLDPATNSKSSLVALGGIGTSGNGKSVVFRFSMAGISGLNVSYVTRASGSSGFTTQTWHCSTDGSSWTAIPGGAITGLTTSFVLKSLPAFAMLDGQANAYVRCTFSGATANTGSNRLDNVVFSHTVAQPPAIAESYAAPSHVFTRADGHWVVGNPSTAAGTAMDTPGAANPAYMFACGDPAAGSSLTAHWNPSSADACCCAWVCQDDAFCCNVGWDSICASKAAGCSMQCTCLGDLNGDHQVTGADLSSLLGAWGSTDSSADLDGSGTVTGADLSMLLGAWGPCGG